MRSGSSACSRTNPQGWRIKTLNTHDPSRSASASQPTAAEIYDRLKTVRRRLHGKPAHILAYESLFRLAGFRAGSISTSKHALAAEYGVSERTADGWITGLRAEGLIELIDSDRGSLHLYVHEPESIEQPRRVAPDPQIEVEFR